MHGDDFGPDMIGNEKEITDLGKVGGLAWNIFLIVISPIGIWVIVMIWSMVNGFMHRTWGR